MVAKLSWTIYPLHHYPFILLLIKTGKDVTSSATFTSTTHASPSPPSVQVGMATSSMVVALQHGKQVTKFITPLGLFLQVLVNILPMHNCIFTMWMMRCVIINAETQTFVDNYFLSFKNAYVNSTPSQKFSSMPVKSCIRFIQEILQFASLQIPKRTTGGTTLRLLMTLLSLLSAMNKMLEMAKTSSSSPVMVDCKESVTFVACTRLYTTSYYFPLVLLDGTLI
jgi:hypothetical protein